MTTFRSAILAASCLYFAFFDGCSVRFDEQSDAACNETGGHVTTVQFEESSWDEQIGLVKKMIDITIDTGKTSTVKQLKETLRPHIDVLTLGCGDINLIQLFLNGDKMQDHELLESIKIKSTHTIRADGRIHPFEPLHFWQGQHIITGFLYVPDRRTIKLWTIVRPRQEESCTDEGVKYEDSKQYFVTVLAFDTVWQGAHRDCDEYKKRSSSFQYWNDYSSGSDHYWGAAPNVEWSVGEWHPKWPGEIIGYVKSYVDEKAQEFHMDFFEVQPNYQMKGVPTAMMAHVNMALDRLLVDIGLESAEVKFAPSEWADLTAFWTDETPSEDEKRQEIAGHSLLEVFENFRKETRFKTAYNTAMKEENEKQLLEEPQRGMLDWLLQRS
eukprot:TRINITY_DN23546_c0_g2_i1.p1 TRINITY_DN23546_c0_g2~~TRINITY_DN23546_c0_g2_i1.p1  ORF type:complete len:383 (+),score=44.13 TRINITY_DN23546_c0_g2_i1:41-1189(+)